MQYLLGLLFLACPEDVWCCVRLALILHHYKTYLSFGILILYSDTNYGSSWARPIIYRHDCSVVNHYTRPSQRWLGDLGNLNTAYVLLDTHWRWERSSNHTLLKVLKVCKHQLAHAILQSPQDQGSTFQHKQWFPTPLTITRGGGLSPFDVSRKTMLKWLQICLFRVANII